MDSGSGCDCCAVIEMIENDWAGLCWDLWDGYHALYYVSYNLSY